MCTPMMLSPPSATASVSVAYTTETYRELLQDHLLSLLQRGPLELCKLIEGSEGAFPSDVVEVLNSLAARKVITNREYGFEIVNKAKTGVISHIRATRIGSYQRSTDKAIEDGLAQLQRALPEPHPLDYDWRFTADSIGGLLDILDKDLKESAKIALLGTPTLYFFLVRRRARATLFDRSGSLLRYLREAGFSENLVQHDLLSPFNAKYPEFDIAVADPPWYPEHYQAFILRAAELLRRGGILLLSVLPWLTRPSAIDDRANLVTTSLDVGFHLIQSIPAFLSYETPPYETATLRKQGIECGNWRKGDLFLFHYLGKRERDQTPLSSAVEEEWDEFLVGRIKVKLKRAPQASTRNFSCRPVESTSPVLGTVSRRDPLRASIDLWTSRNEAYSVEGLTILHDALGRLEQNHDPTHIAHDLAARHHLSEDGKNDLVGILSKLLESSGRSPA